MGLCALNERSFSPKKLHFLAKIFNLIVCFCLYHNQPLAVFYLWWILGMARRRLSTICKWSRLHTVIWHCTVYCSRVWATQAASKSSIFPCFLCLFVLFTSFSAFAFCLCLHQCACNCLHSYVHAQNRISVDEHWQLNQMSTCFSYSRWKMWAWECG